MSVSEWQLIETAPKDGTPILLCVNKADLTIVIYGWWVGDQSMWAANYPWAFIDDHEIIEADNEDFVRVNGVGVKSPPTHWMPLPSPPLT